MDGWMDRFHLSRIHGYFFARCGVRKKKEKEIEREREKGTYNFSYTRSAARTICYLSIMALGSPRWNLELGEERPPRTSETDGLVRKG